MNSQNNEEQLIINYFGTSFIADSQLRTCLSIGENDGKTLSNVLACIQRGWGALLVEPSQKAFNQLFDRHLGNKKVECFNVAISTESALVDFYESGEHLGTGDHALLSSLKKSETEKWSEEFTKTTVQALKFSELLAMSKHKRFDLISIDVEGLDYEVLSQIDLKSVDCKMLIVETNSIDDEKFIAYAASFGMKLYHKNYQNLIFV